MYSYMRAYGVIPALIFLILLYYDSFVAPHVFWGETFVLIVLGCPVTNYDILYIVYKIYSTQLHERFNLI